MIQPRLRFNKFHDTWTYKLLNKIAKITMGQSPLSKNYTHNPNYYLLVQGNADLLNGHIHPRLFTKQITKISHKGNIILTVRAPVGDTAINDYGNLVVGRGVANIRGNRFLYELFNRIQLLKHWNRYSTGSTFDSINSKILKNLNIIVPSLSEQRAIGEFFAKLDKLIQLQQKKVLLLKKLKRGYLQKLFPQKGKVIPQLRFKGFHNKWIRTNLGESMNNFSYGLNTPATKYNGKDKYIRITDIDDITRQFNYSNLSSPKGNLSTKYLLKIGDIVFARTGASTGKTYLYNPKDGRVYYAGFLIKASTSNTNDSIFLFNQTLTDNFFNFIKIYSIRSGQPGINTKSLKSFTFYAPLFLEQHIIGKLFNKLGKLVELQRNKILLLKELKKAYLQKMFC